MDFDKLPIVWDKGQAQDFHERTWNSVFSDLDGYADLPGDVAGEAAQAAIQAAEAILRKHGWID